MTCKWNEEGFQKEFFKEISMSGMPLCPSILPSSSCLECFWDAWRYSSYPVTEQKPHLLRMEEKNLSLNHQSRGANFIFLHQIVKVNYLSNPGSVRFAVDSDPHISSNECARRKRKENGEKRNIRKNCPRLNLKPSIGKDCMPRKENI